MTSARPHSYQRQGSVYVMVLASSMILTTIGLGALFAIRVQRRSIQMTQNMAEARLHAQSAIELGLLFVRTNPNWRSTWSNGTWISEQSLDNGTYSLTGVDPDDGDLADSEYDPLVLTGVGACGIARHQTQVTLVPDIMPLEALNTCIHTSGLLKITVGHLIRAIGAPVSTNGMLDNDEIIDGDAEADSIDTMKTITGTLTVPAAQKTMPDPNVISDYISKATVVPFTGNIDKQVLTPTYNPWGSTNADGVYFIDTGDHDILIQKFRLQGTLIVRLGTKKLTLDREVLMQNYRSDYPVLIIDGDMELKIDSYSATLSEVVDSRNYNPPGAPYQGQSDSDLTDEYPNEVQGLVHVTGFLKLNNTARVKGAIICEGSVECANKNTIIHNPSLYAIPPEGYTYVAGMKVSPESYQQVVD
ncbi:hypothetical protein ACFL5Z_12780 [Planctomycetota bacterium]